MSTAMLSAEALNALTSNIIGAAIAIHRALGPGLFENAYLACLLYELELLNLRVDRQREIPLIYKDVRLPCCYRADLIVEDCVLVEVKALDTIALIHRRQLSTYVRLADMRVGLLLNFGALTLADGIHRCVHQFPEERREGAESAEETQTARPQRARERREDSVIRGDDRPRRRRG